MPCCQVASVLFDEFQSWNNSEGWKSKILNVFACRIFLASCTEKDIVICGSDPDLQEENG